MQWWYFINFNNLFNFCLSEDLLGDKVRTLTEGAGHFYTSSGRVIDKVGIILIIIC